MRRFTDVDFHSHTRGSDGMGTPASIALAAKRAGLHFLALTDHHSNMTQEVQLVADALLAVGVTPIIGVEYSTAQNHLLIYGIPPVALDRWGRYPEIQKVVDEVNAAGGCCICPHPYKGYTRSLQAGVESIRGLAAVESINGQVEARSPSMNKAAAKSARLMGVPQTGSSDAHCAEDVGSAFTRFNGHLESVGDVLRALKSGVGFRPMINQQVMSLATRKTYFMESTWMHGRE